MEQQQQRQRKIRRSGKGSRCVPIAAFSNLLLGIVRSYGKLARWRDSLPHGSRTRLRAQDDLDGLELHILESLRGTFGYVGHDSDMVALAAAVRNLCVRSVWTEETKNAVPR